MGVNRLRAFSPLFFMLASVFCIFFLFTAASAFLIFLLPSSFSEGKRFLMVKWMGLFLVFVTILGGLIASKKKIVKLSLREEKKAVGFWPWGILFLLAGGILGALAIFTSPTGGDEGMWANVVRNLILYSHYALGQPGSFQDFSPLITVGPTVILPLTFLYQWIPEGLWVYRIYALGWFLATTTMIYFLYARLLKGWQLFTGLILFFVFLYNPAIQAGYSSVMGEMPALFFLIAGILLLPNQIFLAGVFFGLAIVTKLTLILVMTMPFIYFLHVFLEKQKIELRSPLLFFTGALLSFLPWFLIRSALTNIPFRENIFPDFILFGIGNPFARILRYGWQNFLKLAILAAASTFYLQKAMKASRTTGLEMLIYTFFIFFILWFFCCTDGHFARYMTYPLFLLIPLAVKSLPQNKPSCLTAQFLITGVFFLLLFHVEILNLVKTVSRIRHRTPWISEQLKEKYKSGTPTVWTLNEFDGYDLAILTHPPVFWVREDMLFETSARAPQSYLYYTQINIRVPLSKGKSFPLPPLQQGDLIAIGVPQSKGLEKKLYLLEISQIPIKKTNRFVVTGELPQELEGTLKKDFESLGMVYYFRAKETNEEVYRLELWRPSRELA